MQKKTYDVKPGVERVNGAIVPPNRVVVLSDAEALFDRQMGRISLLTPAQANRNAKPRKQVVGEPPAGEAIASETDADALGGETPVD